MNLILPTYVNTFCSPPAHDMKQREKWARAIRSVAGHSNSTEVICIVNEGER